MAAEYEVNIKINSQQVERKLQDIDQIVSNIGKPKGGGSRKRTGIAGLLPSAEELKANERGIVRLIDRFSQRKERSITRSNTLNKKELQLNKQLTTEVRQRVRLLSQAGAKGFDGTRPQGRQLANDINARVKTQETRARLVNKINELEAKGFNVQKLRQRLSKGTTEQSARRFASANKEFRLLGKTIELEKSKLRVLKQQQQGFGSSPVRGTRTMMGSPAQIAASGRQSASPIRGKANLIGSPAYYEAQQRAITRLARQGGASSSVKGNKNLIGSPAYYEAQQRAITRLARQGGATSPIRGGLQFPGSPKALAGAQASRTPFGPSFPSGGAASPVRGGMAFPGSPIAIQAAKKTQLGALKIQSSWGIALGELQETAQIFKSKDARIKQSWITALSALEDTAQIIKVRSQAASSGLTGQSSPIGGTASTPGSPAFLNRQRRNKKLGQVGLGVGFPLLFGGGAGSVLGGGIGGLTGSFGAQIAFSAIGQQIDQMVASVMEAGKAFTSVGDAASFMAEKSLFSSDSMQFRIEKLIEEGKVTEAAALMTQEMAKQVGGSGLKALKDLGTEATKMGKLFGTVMLRIQAFMAKALAPLIALINRTIGGMVANDQLNQMLEEAGSPERRAKIEARANELRGTEKSGRRSMKKGDFTPEMLATLQGEFPAIIPEGAAIEATTLERLRAGDKTGRGADKAAREEERLQNRLAKLEEERQKILEISRFKDQIAAAEILGDSQLVIRLQGEQKMVEIEASRKQALVGITEQREIDAINIGKATEKLANQRDIERQLTEEHHKRQELFNDTIAGLEHQLELAQATSEAERERLRIEEKLRKLRKGGMSEERVGQVGALMQQISEENSPLNQFIKQSTESLNNLEAHAVAVSQNIGNAVGSSLVNGMQGLITGATSVKEVFADMLKSIADVLAQQASQMIATYIAIGIAKMFAGMGSGLKASGGGTPAPGAFTPGGKLDTFGVGVPGFAEGGYVTGPTNALIGEGGESEYVVPASKMNEAMGRYARGARGAAVIPNGSGGDAGGEMGGGGSIDVTYSVERINNVNYVTAAEFEKGMTQAAKRGAEMGKRGVYSDLVNKRSVRSRVGI